MDVGVARIGRLPRGRIGEAGQGHVEPFLADQGQTQGVVQGGGLRVKTEPRAQDALGLALAPCLAEKLRQVESFFAQSGVLRFDAVGACYARDGH
jgi:hypothetical protein